MDEKKITHHMTGSGAWVAVSGDQERRKVWDEEGRVVMVEVMDIFSSKGTENFGPTEITPANLLSNIVWSLEWDYAAAITGIFCDQWSGVQAKKHDGTFSTWVECDLVEHGIAATWVMFHEHHANSTVQDSSPPND